MDPSQGKMGALLQDSILECQICFNCYSLRHRPKLLDCRHTCCSVCLTQMRMGQRELRCPWCRSVTRLPASLPVSQLPDDPAIIATVAFPRAPECGAIFVHLPGMAGYGLPLTIGDGRSTALGRVGYRSPAGTEQKGVAVVVMPEREGDVGEGEQHSVTANGVAWSGVCTVVLLGFVLLFLLGIVLHNMFCISKRFAVISCG